jgi:quinol monooxygenase YgiN
MTVGFVQTELVEAGLHEESVEDLIEHYRDMRFHLSNENYVEAGAHVGNFCENLANIIRAETGEGIDPHIQVGEFLQDILNGNIPKNGLDYEIYTTIPRTMRVAYDLRNNRDSVHVNLEVEVNHSDTQTAVRLCTWMLSELLRTYSDAEHRDEVAELIEQLANPMTPYVDTYNGNRIVMSQELDLQDELLVHLYALGREVGSETLAEWIIGADPHKVGSCLGNLKQKRMVHYEDGVAKITPIGAEEAEKIVEENFNGSIPDIERRDEQMANN